MMACSYSISLSERPGESSWLQHKKTNIPIREEEPGVFSYLKNTFGFGEKPQEEQSKPEKNQPQKQTNDLHQKPTAKVVTFKENNDQNKQPEHLTHNKLLDEGKNNSPETSEEEEELVLNKVPQMPTNEAPANPNRTN